MDTSAQSTPSLDAGQVRDEFRRHFPEADPDPVLAFAPGRVNLIGDHIDYCGGCVLPMPIQFGTWVAVSRADRGILARSNQQPPVRVDPGENGQPDVPWGRFASGAVAVLAAGGARIPDGLRLYAAGDIPGGGLSSSASLSIALLLAIGGISACRLEDLELALAAQRIEHKHIGLACGLMDQAVIVLGRADAALRFDCAVRRGDPVILPAGLAVVVADSGVPRTLAASAYNQRRGELERAAKTLQLEFDTLARTLPEHAPLDDPLLARRARHVASEQRRVHEACAALERAELDTFGVLLDASHASLRDDYEVSCSELDALAAAFRAQPGCHGARMTGAGFGGAVVAAVASELAAEASAGAAASYRQRTGITPRVFLARSQGGARVYG